MQGFNVVTSEVFVPWDTEVIQAFCLGFDPWIKCHYGCFFEKPHYLCKQTCRSSVYIWLMILKWSWIHHLQKTSQINLSVIIAQSFLTEFWKSESEWGRLHYHWVGQWYTWTSFITEPTANEKEPNWRWLILFQCLLLVVMTIAHTRELPLFFGLI